MPKSVSLYIMVSDGLIEASYVLSV